MKNLAILFFVLLTIVVISEFTEATERRPDKRPFIEMSDNDKAGPSKKANTGVAGTSTSGAQDEENTANYNYMMFANALVNFSSILFNSYLNNPTYEHNDIMDSIKADYANFQEEKDIAKRMLDNVDRIWSAYYTYSNSLPTNNPYVLKGYIDGIKMKNTDYEKEILEFLEQLMKDSKDNNGLYTRPNGLYQYIQDALDGNLNDQGLRKPIPPTDLGL